MWPSHLRTTLPFLNSTSVLSLQCRGRHLVEVSMWRSLSQVGDLAVDVLGPVVGVEGLDGEVGGGEELLQHENHEVPGDAGHGAKVLELRDFVDGVDNVDVPSCRRGRRGGRCRRGGPGWPSGRGLRRTPMETGVGRVLPKVRRPVRYCRVLRRLYVNVAVADGGEAGSPQVAVDVEHAPQDHLVAGPEGWPKVSSTSASRAAS